MTEAWFEANPQIFLPLPYVGMDFQGDPDMGLPTIYSWGPTGMSLCFLHLLEYLRLYVYYDDMDIVLVALVDVGEVGHLVARLVGHQLIR